MIIKGPEQLVEIARTAVTRAEVREHLVDLWAQVLERELRADLDAEADASGENDRLRAIHNAPVREADDDAERA